MQPYLSIIIPAYNEARRIGTTLEKIKTYSDTVAYTVEVIVVINNTTDATSTVVQEFTTQMPYVHMIDIGMIESGSGTKGYAVQVGMQAATGKYQVFMDADNATDISEIEKMFPFFEQGYDVVFGSRYVRGAAASRVWYRSIMGRISNLLVQAVLLPGIYDTQCGFKAFTQKAAKEIFSRTTLKGWGFDIEVLAIARIHQLKIKEVPVVWKEVGASSVKAGAFLTSLKELFEVRKNKKEGRYV